MDKQMSLSVLSKEKETLHYSRISVLLCLLHIPYKMKNGYFFNSNKVGRFIKSLIRK